jgi:hypothetical protein
MERLAVPEDDATPDTPFQIVIEGELETRDPDRACGTYVLCFGQLRLPVREEELVTPLFGTSAMSLDLYQSSVHCRNLSRIWRPTRNRRVFRRPGP